MSGRDRLGKGLGALLGEYLEPAAQRGEIHKLPVSAITGNPVQPRRVFKEGELEELAVSIRENGLLQPLVVRPAPAAAGRYELVVGERRLRAVTRLGWTEVPVLVRDASDETLLVLALVENLQREALNPLEEAEGYAALGERYGMSQSDIANAVGKDRSTVANMLRLLKLPPSIRKLVEDESLSMGHARALLSVADPLLAAHLARAAVKQGWSVREVEKRARGVSPNGRSKGAAAVDPVIRELEVALRDSLATHVSIKQKRGGKGSIEIRFHGAEDFERVFALITRREVSDVVE
jgi:ParB family chromosome partitioning protein